MEEQNPPPNSNNNNTPQSVVADSASDTLAKFEAASLEVVVKRRRGRPRKYDVNGNLLSPTSPPGFPTCQFESSVKRSRGRPRGSGKLQILASIGGCVAETAGGSFTPYVLTVNTGEDVVSKILSFFQKGPRAVCILSATGTVSSVTLRLPSVSGGILIYEGRFEIISLSGSCTYTGGPGGSQRKDGALSVSLAKPDGRVFGGAIESSMIAGGPIQLVVATFKQNISKQIKKRNSSGFSPAPGNLDSSERAPRSKVPKVKESEISVSSPTSGGLTPQATTSGVSDTNAIPVATTNGATPNDVINVATTNGIANDVLVVDHNMYSVSVNGASLDLGGTNVPHT